MYWLLWPRVPWLLSSSLMLLVWLGVLAWVWYFWIYKKNEHTVVEQTDDEDEWFDLELWHWALQYLRNHHDDLTQWVFMNELYRLFIDALGAKYDKDELLETATREQIETMNFLKQKEKELLWVLYTPVFQAWERDCEKRDHLIDQVEHLVIWRDDLASHDW